MNLGVAGFGHETISFWPGLTELEAFERNALYGGDLIKKRRDTNTVVGGIIEVCEAEGADLYPILEARGGATATVADRVYDFYVSKMKRGFADAADRLDGILLAMHGAMVTESRQDPETDAVREIRQVVGYDIPIMVAFDLHGNKDKAILKEATAVFGYHSSPHVDMAETGRRASKAIIATLKGDVTPTVAFEKPGIVVPSVYSATTVSPGKDIIERLEEWEKRPGVLDVTALFGFAWSDVHQLGMSMIAITDNNPKLAEDIVDDLVNFAWRKREALTGRGRSSLYSVKDGVALAIKKAKKSSKPLIILDHADRTNDTTFVLRELISQEAKNVAFPLFYSPEAAEACIAAGVGKIIELEVGASTGWRDGRPVKVKGDILWAGEGKYIGTGPMRKNLEIDHGPTAIIDANGIWLQFTTYKASLIDEDPITQFGYNTQDFDIIVTKSKTHFRAVFEKVGDDIIIIDSPGQCPADLRLFDYKNAPKDLYPFKTS